MTGFEYLGLILKDLVLPPKGIIPAEIILILRAMAHMQALLELYAPTIITAFAIYFVIAFVVFERMPHRHHHGGIVARIIGFLITFIVTVAFAWGFLLAGLIAGMVGGDFERRAQQNANIELNYRRPITRNTSVIYRITRLSIHFRIGRGIYRLFYRLIGRIRVMRNHREIQSFLAMTGSLIIFFMGMRDAMASFTSMLVFYGIIH